MEISITNFYLGAVRNRKGITFSIFRVLLTFFSAFYYLVVKIRRNLYTTGILRQAKLPCTVISIGNITAGGTGKTPAVIMVAKTLKEQGKNVAILSRGYRSSQGLRGIKVVSDRSNILLSPEAAGDEPYLLARNLRGIPVIVYKNRVNSGGYAIKEFGVDVLILDDGFQYLPLKRELEVVTIDSLVPFSNKRLIPRGLLREPLSHLKRADIFLLTRTDQVTNGRIHSIYQRLKNINSAVPVVETVHRPAYLYRINSRDKKDLEFIKEKEISVVASIGNPQSFESTLKMLGANVVRRFYFPDHYWYSDEDIQRICEEDRIIITTEKDEVLFNGKIEKENMFVLKIAMEITKGGKQWEERIKNYL